MSNVTVAAGMILEASATPAADVAAGHRAGPERPHSQVSPEERRQRLGQKGCAVWLTGLPGAGKTQIAFALERRLFDLRRIAMVVDPADGATQSPMPSPMPTAVIDGSIPRRTEELARRCAEAGLIVVFSYASPARADREAIRAPVGAGCFVEVHVGAGSPVNAQRRPGGQMFSEEAPARPDLVVSLDKGDPERAANAIVEILVKRCFLPPLDA